MNSRRSTRGLLAAFSVIGAGLIHLAAIRSHLGSPMAAASFAGIGLVQILLGASLLQTGALRVKRLATLGVGALAVGAWLVSRTWGLPAVSGHTGPEPFGAADFAAFALQLVSLVLIVMPERATAPSPRRLTGAFMALPIVAISAVASLSLLSVPSHGHGHSTAVETRTAAYSPPPVLTKRVVPIPATTDPASPPTSAPGDHASAPAHSH